MHGNGSDSTFGADVKDIEELMIPVHSDADDVKAGSVLCMRNE